MRHFPRESLERRLSTSTGFAREWFSDSSIYHGVHPVGALLTIGKTAGNRPSMTITAPDEETSRRIGDDIASAFAGDFWGWT